MLGRRGWSLVAFLLVAAGGVLQATLAPDPLSPARTGGLAAVDRALAKLATHRRLLVVGAHPDDEDTALLAWVSQALGGEAAYLSLSRGEGGQNLIGPELGVGLGLLRSEELAAARRIDGARQYFTRAFDFGYTRSIDETLERWPLAELERDALRIVRRFKPQVIVSTFPADQRAGHGQHQAAGVVAQEIWQLARDPAAHPELAGEEGLPPWAPQAFYRSAWWEPEEATLTVTLAEVESIGGRSVGQLAAASRSMHRSQDMGRPQALGEVKRPLAWVAGGAGAAGEEPFAGIDTRLAAIADLVPEREGRAKLSEQLIQVEEEARGVRAALSPLGLAAAAEALARVVGQLEETLALLEALEPTAGVTLARDLLAEKLEAAHLGLAAAAGLAFDAKADRERVVGGEPLAVTLELWNTGSSPVQLQSVELVAASGWEPPVLAVEDPSVEPGELARFETEWSVGRVELSTPYFLARPLDGSLYDWSEAPPAVRGEPFEPPPLVARALLTVAGARLVLQREVVHVYADQAVGEVRRPLLAVPLLEIRSSPERVLWPLGDGAPRTLELAVRSNAAHTVVGHVEVALGEAGPRLEPIPFEIPAGRGSLTLPLVLEPPGSSPGSFAVRAAVAPGGASAVERAFPLVDYPHVRPRPQPRPATTVVERLDVALPALERIAYVRGASDRVPEALLDLGLPLELVEGAALEHGNLVGYDAIVVGPRASETDPALARANGRLLEYARDGGLVLVQYQQYPWIEGGHAPFGLTIARPHGRVTDETSPVRLLVPEHPVFQHPNPIGEADWQGWVQERGLYFAETWGEPFQPLLALQDPGQPELAGSLLVAPVGRGAFVYTGLAFFRQLPAGVPGALRLFANLLALAEEPSP